METVPTILLGLALRLIRLLQRIIVFGLLGSLINGIHRDLSFKAAERIEVHFEEMSIPISINELDEWSKDYKESNSELGHWLSLLGFESRTALANFFKEPFVKDKNAALMLLRSWFGRKLLEEFGDLVHLDEKTNDSAIFNTVENLLETENKVNLLDVFRALPSDVIHIDLDELVQVAKRLRLELKLQQRLVSDLRSFSPEENLLSESKIGLDDLKGNDFDDFLLEVSHRKEPLEVEVWHPSNVIKPRKNFIVFMPGLGGDQAHFHWLSRSLSNQGWPVVLLQHPGSDSNSLKALLQGKMPAPGVEMIPERLEDLRNVIDAIEEGSIKVQGQRVILMGHSLGALTAFLASGVNPQGNLEKSCSNTINDFSLTNLSELLQCEFVDLSLPPQGKISSLSAIVGINSFGSLLWPIDSRSKINLPIFLTGGTFDLVTPAISEQLKLFLATKTNRFSRVLIIEGASHFSPIRVSGQINNKRGEDVFKLGESLVGIDPLSVQSLLAYEIINFLNEFEKDQIIPSKLNIIRNDMRFHILDRSTIKKLIY